MRKIVVIAFMVVALVAAGAWYRFGDPGPTSWLSTQFARARQAGFTAPVAAWLTVLPVWQSGRGEAEPLTASGFIEARHVSVVPEVSGRIEVLSAREGDPVSEGDVLVVLDTSLLDAQIAEAEAAVAVAEASLARVQAGPRDADTAVAEAALVLAEAQRDSAYQTWLSTIRVRDNPQELDLQIAAARSSVAVLDQRVLQAAAVKDAAELLNGLAERQVQTAEGGATVTIGGVSTHVDVDKETRQKAWASWNLATSDVWTAWTNLQGMQAARDAGAASVAQLEQLRANQQEVAVSIARAEAAYNQAEAAVAVAQSQLDLARAGASDEQTAMARTAVVEAQRALDTLRVQRAKATIVAPMAGFISERNAAVGEIAVAGRPLLVVGSLDTIELRAYVPEPNLGAVHVGQRALVSVDAFPGEAFVGEVTWIADKAEYTPRNVSTQEERAQTVYAVLIRVENADHRLKPGMPADAVFSQ